MLSPQQLCYQNHWYIVLFTKNLGKYELRLNKKAVCRNKRQKWGKKWVIKNPPVERQAGNFLSQTQD